MMTYNPSAYLVVAAVDDKASFDQAERILSYLRSESGTCLYDDIYNMF